jgi:hypothetical protein
MHPLFTTLLARPQLLTDHAEAYMALATAEGAAAMASWRRRALLAGGALLMAVLALAWGGQALLMAAALPTAGMPAAWLLWLLPAASAAAAALLLWLALKPAREPAFAVLKHQWAVDRQLWQALAAEQAGLSRPDTVPQATPSTPAPATP